MKTNRTRFKTLRALALSSLLAVTTLYGCAPSVIEPGSDSFNIQSAFKNGFTDYVLKADERFTIKAVDSEHQEAVNASVANFESDLTNNALDDYYTNPDFSVLLSAGSEGNAFSTQEGIQEIMKQGAVFAQTVVFNPGESTPAIYKGQFNNGRFYFHRSVPTKIQANNTTYLVALTLELETQVFKGQLSAGSEGNYLSAGSEGNFLSAGSEGNFLDPLQGIDLLSETPVVVQSIEVDPRVLETNLEQYRESLGVYKERTESFTEELHGVRIVSRGLHPWAYTQPFAYLSRAYYDEVKLEHDLVRGLPKNLLHRAFKNMIDRLSQRWEADCGYPVPDDGTLFPQLGAKTSPIPWGFHSPELAAVINDLPELKAELKAKIDLPGSQRYGEGGFLAFILDYQARYPEVFAKHNWTDKFAPPDCVKPYTDEGGLKLPPPPGGPGQGPPPTGPGQGPPPAGPPPN